MIKLGGLVTLKPITEADVFTATSKETGTTSVFKSKDARDAAIKAGTHEKRKDDKDGAVKDPTDKPKVNIFKKDKKDEPKSEPIEVDMEEIEDFTQVDDLIAQHQSKLSKQQIDTLSQLSADWEDAEGEMMMGGDDEADAEYQRAISRIKSDIKKTLRNPKGEEPKSEPKKDEPINLTDDFIDNLKDEYSQVRILMPGAKEKLKKSLIDKLDREQLEKLGGSDVKHVSKMARIHLKKIDSGEVAGPEKDKKLTKKSVEVALRGDSSEINNFLDDNESKFSKEDFEYLKKQSSDIKQMEDELEKAEREGDQEEVYDLESDIGLTKSNLDNIIFDMLGDENIEESPSTRLKDLLPEEETFTAVNKKSGQTSVFKSKASRDSAIKKGTHSKTKEKGDSKKGGKGGVNIFNKDKEEPKSEPKKDSTNVPQKDSTGGRAGNIEVNKEVRLKTKRMGITPKNLGKEEYQRRMSQAAVEALIDSNFHSEARKLIAMLEDKPEWANDPNQDPNKPDIFSPEYKEWEKTSVYSSDLYNSSPGTDEIGQFASAEAKYNGQDAIDAIAFDLKLNGSKELALKMQSIFDEQNESSTSLKALIPEQHQINEGTRSQVGIIDRSGKIASGYVHYDGYPSNMKKGLKKHMKNEKDILNLIKKGGARGIYNNKDIEYFNEKPSPIKGNFKDI